MDRDRKPLYTSRYPSRAYEDFSEIPPIIVSTVLFVENRDILDPNHPYRNPAIGWGRLSRAMVNFGLHEIDHKRPMIGGSTLSDAIGKNAPFARRQDSFGRRETPADHNASLRAYRRGPETLAEQQRIVLDYINSIPMAATPAGGEDNRTG